MLHAYRPLARLATSLYSQAACAGSRKISTTALVSSGVEQVGPAEAAREQDRQEGDTDYNATPAYPNKTPEDAGEAAMAASKAPHPSGPVDTSSVNDPSGRAEGSYQQQQGQDFHSMRVHHPGREADVASMPNSSSSSGSGGDGGGGQNIDQDSFTAGSGGGATSARIDVPGSGPSGEGTEGPGNLNAGVEATNVIPGAERAMTADFAAGGDDVNPPGMNGQANEPASVNEDTGLPQMPDVDTSGGAGQGSKRFGELKKPGDVGEQGMTARQTEQSTGMDPGGLGSS